MHYGEIHPTDFATVLMKGIKMNKINLRILLNIFFVLNCSTSLGQEIKYFERPTGAADVPYDYGLKFCKANWGHMPTAREWAQIAKERFGAKGIVEYTENSSLPGPDFVLITSPKDAVGNVDKFYYSNMGFHTKEVFSLMPIPYGHEYNAAYEPYDYNIFLTWVSVGSNLKNISAYIGFNINNGTFVFDYGQMVHDVMVICIDDTKLTDEPVTPPQK